MSALRGIVNWNKRQETVVTVRDDPYGVIRHWGYLAAMVYFSLLPAVLSRWVDFTVLAAVCMVVIIGSCV